MIVEADNVVNLISTSTRLCQWQRSSTSLSFVHWTYVVEELWTMFGPSKIFTRINHFYIDLISLLRKYNYFNVNWAGNSAAKQACFSLRVFQNRNENIYPEWRNQWQFETTVYKILRWHLNVNKNFYVYECMHISCLKTYSLTLSLQMSYIYIYIYIYMEFLVKPEI
jgi:hypothetical protein